MNENIQKISIVDGKLKSWLIALAILLGAISSALYTLTSCTSSKGLTLKADSIKTLNVQYVDSTAVQWPKK